VSVNQMAKDWSIATPCWVKRLVSKHGQSILYTSAEISDCIPRGNVLVIGVAEKRTRMLTTYCVSVAYFLITTACRFLRLFRALPA
jgi:hypothetical protein